MAYVFGVLVGVYQADTGRLAALDLVLQARSSAIAVVAVFALAYQKGLLQQAEAFTNGPGTRIGAEITPFGALGATVQAQAWKVVIAGKENVRVRLVVAQQNIIRRPVSLDQALLQQQRLGFVGGDGGVNLLDAADQCLGLGAQAGFAEVAGQALFKVAGLADIQQCAVGIEHAIDPGFAAGRGEKGARIERC